MFADIDHIAIRQPMWGDEFPIDKRAVFAFQIDIHKGITGRIDLAVVTGYGQVFDDDIIIFQAPNF